MKISLFISLLLTSTECHAAVIKDFPQKVHEKEKQNLGILMDFNAGSVKPEDSFQSNDILLKVIRKECNMKPGGLSYTSCIISVIFQSFNISECLLSFGSVCMKYGIKRHKINEMCYELKKLKYHEEFANHSRCTEILMQHYHMNKVTSNTSFTQRKLLATVNRNVQSVTGEIQRMNKDNHNRRAKEKKSQRTPRTNGDDTLSHKKVMTSKQHSSQLHVSDSENLGISETSLSHQNIESEQHQQESLHSRPHAAKNLTNVKLAVEEYEQFLKLMEQNFSKDPQRAMLSVTVLMIILMVAIKLCGMKPQRKTTQLLDYPEEEHHASIHEILRLKRQYLPKKFLHWERKLRRKFRRKQKVKKKQEIPSQIVSDNSEEESLIYSQAVDF